MPLRKVAQKRESPPPQGQEEPEARAERSVLEEPSDVLDMELERPYQSFVESEARQYWQEIGIVGSLTKPTQQEIRTAAMPVLGQGLWRRTGSKKYVNPDLGVHAVGAMTQHALERGWIKPPLSEAYNSRSYIRALIELARDADWAAKEIRLPDHPPIYYTRDSFTGKLVPSKDSYINGEYLSDVFGSKLSKDSRIYPSTSPNRGHVFFTLDDMKGTPSVRIHYIRDEGRGWRDFSGVKSYDKALEDLRSANMRIVSLKGSGLSWQERERGIYEIRKSFGLH